MECDTRIFGANDFYWMQSESTLCYDFMKNKAIINQNVNATVNRSITKVYLVICVSIVDHLIGRLSWQWKIPVATAG